MANSPQLSVFYDGACPLCMREISFYQRQKGAEDISWINVSAPTHCKSEIVPGLSRDQALARFHVLDADGTLVSGGRAFAKVWEALPRFRVLAWPFRFPPFAWALERAYDFFLKFRPRLQAIARKRQSSRDGVLPAWLRRELRSDHAGETGAVAIHHGILAVSRNTEVRAFATAHLTTERQHLQLIEDVVPARGRSLFTPLWRAAGFLTGAVPALFGSRAVFFTIDAVETFVDRHYAAQVDRLIRDGTHPDIRVLLERCRQDEVRHRDEARQRHDGSTSPFARAWSWAVGAGSAAAVAVARRL